MTAPATLLRPFERLVALQIGQRVFQVPENNTLLRCLQYLAPEPVSYGRFCWNQECQSCRIVYDRGDGTEPHAALACKVMIEDGMRILEMTSEMRYCLRTLR